MGIALHLATPREDWRKKLVQRENNPCSKGWNSSGNRSKRGGRKNGRTSFPTFVSSRLSSITIRPRVIRGMASFRPSKTMGKETEVALVPPLMELHPWRWLYTRPPPCSKSILLVFRGGGRSDLKKETKDCKIFRRMYRLEKEGRGVIYFCW